MWLLSVMTKETKMIIQLQLCQSMEIYSLVVERMHKHTVQQVTQQFFADSSWLPSFSGLACSPSAFQSASVKACLYSWTLDVL